MPITKITRDHFPLIDWKGVKAHIAAQREAVHTTIYLFATSKSNGWMANLEPDGEQHQSPLVIPCQFWLDPYSRRSRPRLTDPDRTSYFTKGERIFLARFLGTITNQPWLNLKTVWLKNETPGLITIHFKVYDYAPFLKGKTTAPK